jgi:two-component system, NarL family, sensor kinase
MRFFVLLVSSICLFIEHPVHSQEYYDRDSLWQLLREAKPDTNKVQLYIQLGQQYENNNPDSALRLYEAALKLSTELNYTRGIISYYTNATYVYNVMSRLDTSLILNLQSVEIARKFGVPERLAACLSNTGASYMNLKRYEKSIEYFLQAIEIYDQLGDLNKRSVIYRNLASVYLEIGQKERAAEYGEESLALARQTGNVYSIAGSLVNLANVYASLREFNKAIALFEEARLIAKNSENEYVLLITSLSLCDVYNASADFSKVKTYGDEALALAIKLDDRQSIAMALRALAIYFFNNENPLKAEEYASRSLDQAIKYNYTEDIGHAYSLLAEISILKKEFKKNNYYSFKSDSIRNVLLNESIARNIQELEAKYQSEKKEQQINDLKQEAEIKDLSIKQNRLFNFILVGSLIAVLAIALLAGRTHQQKKRILEKENALSQSRIAELEREKQLMAGEAVIKGQDEERGRLAKDLHDGLGGLLSGVKFSLTNMKSNVILDADSALVFERSLDMLDHSIAELRRVAHNMMPEVLVKFGLSEALKSYCAGLRESQLFKIDFQSIGMENRLSSNTEIFIYRIIQELLNNTAKHAKATQVLVQLARQNGEVSITVEDDGVGFDSAVIQHTTGAGWANIQSRVEYLKGKLDIQAAPGQGTSVHITIPAP